MDNSEALLIGWLNGDDQIIPPAFGEIPADRPSSFVTVERTGGQRTQVMDYPTFAVQCWAGSRAEAADFAELVRDRLVRGFALHPRVASCDVASLYNFPDLESGQARYQLTVTAVVLV